MVGIVVVSLTILINFDELSDRLEPALERISEFVGAFGPVVLPLLIVVSSAILGSALSRLVNLGIRLAIPRVQAAVSAIGTAPIRELKEIVQELADRLATVEERLRIGEYEALNLPDNLPPDTVRSEVQRYEREHGFRYLWAAVERHLRGNHSGYLIIKHRESSHWLQPKGKVTHYSTRSEAEKNLERGMVLVHAIESDWKWKKERMVTLDIEGATDRFDDSHRKRYPKFMSVDHNQDGFYTFRFDLREEGRDESIGRVFDWWLERLQDVAGRQASAESEGQNPQITVQDDYLERNVHYQTQYVGTLAREGQAAPRRHSDGSLLAFTLRHVKLTRTWHEYR